MKILTWIIFGLIAGGIAKMISPGKDPGGWIGSIVVGILGGFLGGGIGSLLGIGDVDSFYSPRSWLLAIGGALILLFIYKKVMSRR